MLLRLRVMWFLNVLGIDQEKSDLQDSISFGDSLADFAMESARFCTR